MTQATVRCFPLGGVGEFGKNMMIYAVGDDALIVDCGMGFPDESQHGVDLVVPDISALDELKLNIHAIVLTHGHEDHIGGLPFLLPHLRLPVYGTPVTLALVQGKLDESGFKGDLRDLPEQGKTEIGPFKVEAIPVTHSIMDAVSVVIHTSMGAIIHTGDFKLDPSPIDGRVTELHRFARLGDEGVLLLSSDSTNATRAGSGASESSVGPALKQAMSGCSGKIVVTTFASNMFRIQQIIDAAIASGRKVAMAGRSLEKNVEITRQLSRLNIPANALVDVKAIRDIPDRDLLIIATGSQGEFRAALARIAHDRFKEIHLNTGDLVIFSSSAIPGNEKGITNLFNHIYRRGARIMHTGQAPLHVSGHAASHELKTMIQLTRPKYFYPVHGEYRYLVEHRDLAVKTGVPFENTVLAENGTRVDISDEAIAVGESFHVGAVFVDGTSRDEVDYAVLKDRRTMASEGMVTVTVVISQQEGKVLGEPEIVARGLLRESIGEFVIEEMCRGLKHYLDEMDQETLADFDEIKEEIRLWVRRWIKRQIGARPMVLPSVIEV